MSDEDTLREELERLKAENEKLKTQTQATRSLSLKVSEKGGVSVYGIRRFPITFYADEWDILLGMSDQIQTFIRENESDLKKTLELSPRNQTARVNLGVLYSSSGRTGSPKRPPMTRSTLRRAFWTALSRPTG